MRVTSRLIAIVVACLSLATPGWSQVVFAPDPTPRVSVVGSGSVEVQPDLAKITLGVYVLNNDIRKGKTLGDAAVARLLEVAADLGVEERDVSSSALDISPSYADEDQAAFLGYEVSRSVEVTLRDLAKLDRLIDRAIDAGANRRFDVDLRTSRLAAIQDQAMELAVADAKAQASRLASGFGAKLGCIREVGPSSGGNSMRTAIGSIQSGGGTFAPGTITIKSEIRATFLLEPL